MSDTHAAPLEDEPHTPMWLPALGVALFVGAGLWWVLTPSAAPIAAAPAASASTPVASAALVAQAAPVASSAARPSAAAAPPPMPGLAGHPPPGTAPGGPAADERLRRLREQMQLKGAGGHP